MWWAGILFNVFFFGRDKEISAYPEKRPHRPWGHPAFYLLETGFISRENRSRGVKLTTHFHLAPRLRMCGATLIIPIHSFVACTGTTLHFFIRELGRLISFGSAEEITLTELLKDLCRGVPESFTCLTDEWKTRVLFRFWSGLGTQAVHGQPSLTAVPLCDFSL
jgi:hypothetical protein